MAAEATDPNAINVRRDLQINLNTRQFVLVNGDLALCTGMTALRQAIDLALKQIQGEWFLNALDGLPYTTDILGKNTQKLADIEARYRARLLAITGVDSVTSLQLVYDGSSRRLTVTWVLTSAFGQLKGLTVV